MGNKKRILSLFFALTLLLTLTLPSYGYGQDESTKGSLVIIGGALKPDNEEVYGKFIELGGGKENIKIAIIPAASSTPVSSSESYKTDFIKYGVPDENIKIVHIALKDDKSTPDVDESTWANNGFSEEIAMEIKDFNAVFFVGGDQMRIVKALMDEEGNDGPVLEVIRGIYDKGGVIGGTSAGAAIMSQWMISGGTSLGALVQGVTYEDNYGVEGDNRVFITKGLGFLDNAIVDQHFLKRGRLGRLIVSCFDKKVNMGYGIDENTALIVADSELEVVGESGVMIVDISNASKDKESKAFEASNIKIHYLEKGDKYNIETKEFSINNVKSTTVGYEYYSGNSLNTNIFGLDSVKTAITIDLVDNKANQSVGLSFDMENETKGTGVKLIFRKGEDTNGFWGKINGKESYAAIDVYLDIVPIEVKIK